MKSSRDLLNNHISTLNSTANKDRVTSLLTALDVLYSLDDKLTLLILENTLADIFHSKLKIHIRPEQDKTPGKFSLATRNIEINNSELHQDFSLDTRILLHEMTHAVSCFAFRLDPFVAKEILDEKGYGDIVGIQSYIKQSMAEFIKNPLNPYHPSKNAHSLRKFSQVGENKFAEGLNPAELKFKHCVKEVADKIKEDGCAYFSEDKDFSTTALSLQESIFDPHNIDKPQDLEEVFSRYMECRLHLLNKAKQNSIPADQVFTLLEKLAPKLHDYFETDVKKLLQYRLMYFKQKFPNDFESLYLKTYPQEESKEVKETFRKDGVLKFAKKP
jgi:hypothetical protein